MEETSTEQKKNNNVMTGIIVIALIAAVSIGAIVYGMNTKDKSTSTQPTPTAQVTQPPQTSGKKTVYKTGTYSEVGEYTTPGGQEHVGVKVTLTNDVITDIDVESQAILPMSKTFQGKFISGYKPLVIGKNIDEVMLTQVSGSSLTPKGFNDAIEKIKADAKS